MNGKLFGSVGLVLLLALVAIQGASLWLTRKSAAERQPTYDSAALDSSRCYANAETISCTYTNSTSTPVVGCLKGLVTKKNGGQGLAVESQIICSGIVKPFTTISMAGRWEKGQPIDLCGKPNAYAGEIVDWDLCDFTTKRIPVYAPK